MCTNVYKCLCIKGRVLAYNRRNTRYHVHVYTCMGESVYVGVCDGHRLAVSYGRVEEGES